jgi:hypothetical protein
MSDMDDTPPAGPGQQAGSGQQSDGGQPSRYASDYRSFLADALAGEMLRREKQTFRISREGGKAAAAEASTTRDPRQPRWTEQCPPDGGLDAAYRQLGRFEWGPTDLRGLSSPNPIGEQALQEQVKGVVQDRREIDSHEWMPVDDRGTRLGDALREAQQRADDRMAGNQNGQEQSRCQ